MMMALLKEPPEGIEEDDQEEADMEIQADHEEAEDTTKATIKEDMKEVLAINSKKDFEIVTATTICRRS
jgi:hypothetical protein